MYTRPRKASLFPPGRNRVYTNWARTALKMVVELEELRGGNVMLPAFICQDSFEPLFERLDLTPTFVDVNPSTFHLDIEQARKRIETVDAVVLVHAFGLPAPVKQWATLCNEHNCVLIEDCARAFGARTDGQPVGTYGDYAIYSLQKVSPVSKGGVVIVPESAGDLPIRRPNYGVDAFYNMLPRHIRDTLSVVYPIDVQPRELDAITRRVFERYARRQYVDDMAANRERAMELRAGLEPLGFELQADEADRVYLLLPTLAPWDRDALAHYLEAYHIPHRIIWGNPWAKTLHGKDFQSQFPNAAMISDRILQFECSAMNKDDAEFVIDRVRAFLTEFDC